MSAAEEEGRRLVRQFVSEQLEDSLTAEESEVSAALHSWELLNKVRKYRQDKTKPVLFDGDRFLPPESVGFLQATQPHYFKRNNVICVVTDDCFTPISLLISLHMSSIIYSGRYFHAGCKYYAVGEKN